MASGESIDEQRTRRLLQRGKVADQASESPIGVDQAECKQPDDSDSDIDPNDVPVQSKAAVPVTAGKASMYESDGEDDLDY